MFDFQPNQPENEEPTRLMEFFVIPTSIFENEELTFSEMFVFALIKMLDGKDHCFASNNYMANILDISGFKVSRAISKLTKIGLVQEVCPNTPDHVRVIKINPDWEKNNRDLLLRFNDRIKSFKKTRPCQPAQSENKFQVERAPRSKQNREYNNIIKSLPSEEKLPSETVASPDPRRMGKKVDRTLLKKEPVPVIPPKPIAANSVIGELIQYWEALGLRKSMVGSKAYEQNITGLQKILRGTFFKDGHFIDDQVNRKFTVEEIRTAMKRFSLAATDPDYLPSNDDYKKKLRHHSIASFLFNSLSSNGDRSLFLRYLNNSPEKASQSIKVKKVNPKYQPIINPLRDVYKDFYLRKVRKGMKINLSPQDENNFLDGALKLYNFIADNQSRLHAISDDQEIAKLVCEAIWDWSRRDPAEITSAKFKSDHTYSVLLPGKLAKLGIVDEDPSGAE